MSAWASLGKAIFTGERTWAWRRRLALTGAAVNLAGIIQASWFPTSDAHASMVMGACQAGFLASMGIYAGLATVDDHLKRQAETPPS